RAPVGAQRLAELGGVVQLALAGSGHGDSRDRGGGAGRRDVQGERGAGGREGGDVEEAEIERRAHVGGGVVRDDVDVRVVRERLVPALSPAGGVEGDDGAPVDRGGQGDAVARDQREDHRR